MYDIAVIGLGPAGAAFCRLLLPCLSVLALDRKTQNENGFQKPCGGLLSPGAQVALAKAGLTVPKEVLADPQIFSVRTIDVGTGCTRHYPRGYINCDRHKFDIWLKSLIPSHIEVHHSARCTKLFRQDGAFQIAWLENGQEHTAQARRIVGADGAHSLVRRLFFPDVKIRSYVALQQWFTDAHECPFYACVFDKTVTDCYAWGLTKGENFIFGGAFSAKDGMKKFETLKEKLKAFGFKLENPLKTEGCMVLRPRNPFLLPTAKDGVFLLGEAAGLISASSLEGISYALLSAQKLSAAFNKSRAGRGYSLFKLHMRMFLKSLKSPFMYNPFLRRLVMKSGLTAIPVKED